MLKINASHNDGNLIARKVNKLKYNKVMWGEIFSAENKQVGR
jgi:hypothetical protein